MKKEQILIVDDDPDHLSLVECYVSSYGLPHKSAESGIKAIEHLKTGNISVLVTDMVMPGMDGMELLKYTKKHHPETDVIVMTGYSQQYSYVDVIRAGATDFAEKPFQKDEFFAKLDRVFRERRILRELMESKEKAEAGSKAKTDFINTISHELRTPLNGIIGFTELLRGFDLTPDEQEYLEIISSSADRLSTVINQLLDFSTIDARRKVFKPSHFHMDKFLAELVCSLEPRASEKGLTLTRTVEDSLSPKLLFWDTELLSQILNNIIDNAIKFSKQGEIKIEVTIKDHISADKLWVQFAVKDHGCGLEEESYATIFEPFTQVEEHMTRKHGGAGLGLAISANLVHLMGGEIWVESQINEGSTFYFTIKMSGA